MVPRIPRRKKFRKKPNGKIVRIFAIGMTVSSISIGSAQLTGSTYSAFNSTSGGEMEISSCYIFPSTVKNYRTTALSLVEEINTGFEKLSKVSAELGMDDLESKKEQLFQTGDNRLVSISAQTDSLSTDDELSALNGEIEQSNQLLAKNEAKHQALVNLKERLSEFENNKSTFAEELKIQINKADDSLKEVTKIIQIIQEAEVKAEDCNYEDNFFSNILMDLTKAEEKNKEIIAALALEKENLDQLTERINEWKNEIEDKMTDLDSENSRLSTIISTKKNEISQIEAQKQEELLNKKKEEELKSEDNVVAPNPNEKQKPEDPKGDEGDLELEQEQKNNVPIPKPVDEVKKQDKKLIPDPAEEEKMQNPIQDPVKDEESKDSAK